MSGNGLFRYDAVVVGGGPCGASAAFTLARNGYTVMVIDAGKFPRFKLCGGLLTGKSTAFLRDCFGMDASCLARAGALEGCENSYHIYAGGRRIVAGSNGSPFYFVRRDRFDSRLLKSAAAAGAVVREGTKVVHADCRTGKVHCHDGSSVCAEFIIAADGVHSTVRKAVCGGLRYSVRQAVAVEVAVPRLHVPQEVQLPSVHLGLLQRGYGWLFPNRRNIVAGVGGLLCRGEHPARVLRTWLCGCGVQAGHIPQPRGYTLPFGGHLRRPFSGRVLLAGDAAGFADAVFGEGIYYAMLSGSLAAQAVMQALPVRAAGSVSHEEHGAGTFYMRLLKRNLFRTLGQAAVLHRFLYRPPDGPDRAAVRLFLRCAHRLLVNRLHSVPDR